MTAAILDRPVLRPLPGPREGALVAAHLDPRPCVTNPPQWWDTGDRFNYRAITLCQTSCPLYGTCKPEPGEVGMIRDGIPHDDRGKPIENRTSLVRHHDRIVAMRNQGMSYPHIAKVIGAKATAIQSYMDRLQERVSDRHDRIAELVAQGRGWTDIAEDICARPEAVRAYWARYLGRVARNTPKVLTRMPGVTDDSCNRPSAYREVVIRMLTAPGRPYSHADVAYVIGATKDAVRTYWGRACREYHDTEAAAS